MCDKWSCMLTIMVMFLWYVKHGNRQQEKCPKGFIVSQKSFQKGKM